jgi:hypothetical protein|tara:strand:+ start:4667 stop:5068 length:402 start_codon:yes stop_codon:yes gene_type:complete
MTTELIAMLGGGASGFLFKLIGTLVTAQQKNVTSLIKTQKASDDSADAAAKRTGDGGAWVRRVIVVTVLFGVIIAPFILAHSDEGVTVAKDYSWFWIFKGTSFQTLHGYVILPEIRQTVLAIVGFYFGSSSVK